MTPFDKSFRKKPPGFHRGLEGNPAFWYNIHGPNQKDHEVPMRKVKAKSLIQGPFNNYNVYRGCTHGCIYCDSRSRCYQIDGVFEDIIVKENAVELITMELAKKRNKILVSSGSMCDPYMPIEKELGLSRKVLEVILRYGHGAGFLTKNALAVRDLDLMEKINGKGKAVACFTLTTMDDGLASIIEPHASRPSERLAALKVFADHGITTGVWMTPMLPFITANPENIQTIVAACASAKVKYIISFGVGTTMREGSREYFYAQLDKSFPGLKKKYMQTYGSDYECLAPDHEMLQNLFETECDKYGIAHRREDIAQLTAIPNRQEQLSLF
jgi:DNA repair photolyase